ncbi:class I SAM-dependent methyltransferase [Nocardia sp. CA-135953]|uniref:class I SAM-dependent methyltransferase n=1 Tax=Nocardia sp. CA-135953 TaxID=3239978 RepID=UPI003D985C01
MASRASRARKTASAGWSGPAIGFKEPVLAAARAQPRCRRAVLAIDLREDWAKLLGERGFRPDLSTHWVDEGVLGYPAP